MSARAERVLFWFYGFGSLTERFNFIGELREAGQEQKCLRIFERLSKVVFNSL